MMEALQTTTHSNNGGNKVINFIIISVLSLGNFLLPTFFFFVFVFYKNKESFVELEFGLIFVQYSELLGFYMMKKNPASKICFAFLQFCRLGTDTDVFKVSKLL